MAKINDASENVFGAMELSGTFFPLQSQILILTIYRLKPERKGFIIGSPGKRSEVIMAKGDFPESRP